MSVLRKDSAPLDGNNFYLHESNTNFKFPNNAVGQVIVIVSIDETDGIQTSSNHFAL